MPLKIVYYLLSIVKLIILKVGDWKDVNRNGVRFILWLVFLVAAFGESLKAGPTAIASMEGGKVGWGPWCMT
jgi:uncharacterized membrane protein YhaH (DUF805 family)